MKKSYLLLISFLFVVRFLTAQVISVVSDLSWKSSGIPETGWNNINFDDSSWPNVIHPSVPWSPQNDQPTHKYSKDVILIWDQYASPAYMRRSFTLNDLDLDSAVVWGTVDDDMDYYVNGNLIFQKSDCTPNIFRSNIAKYLRKGENVLAVKGINCFVYQWLCSELIIYPGSHDTTIIQNYAYYDIFPVPCTDFLTFKGFRPNVMVKIKDGIGRAVLSQPLVSNRLNVSYLAPGLYVVSVLDNGILITKKIVKCQL